MSFIKKFLY